MGLPGFFHRDPLLRWQVDLYGFFPLLGVDIILVLHHGTQLWLNRSMVKKLKKKKDDEEKSQQKNHFAMAGIWIHILSLPSWALYPLDPSALLHCCIANMNSVVSMFQALPSLFFWALLQLVVQGRIRPHRAVHRLHCHLRPHVLAPGEMETKTMPALNKWARL